MASIYCSTTQAWASLPLWENTASDWQWVTQVNLYGVAWGVKAFTPIMLDQGEGHIVNIASAAGWMYSAGSGIYNATKAAVVALSESLANDLKMANSVIGVSVLSPAFFPTGIIDAERNFPHAWVPGVIALRSQQAQAGMTAFAPRGGSA